MMGSSNPGMPAEHTGGFGARLREARERRGISLRQIAAATKISTSVLEALERNDISRLPGGIFSRAFVRGYAAQVGLDPEATIRDFLASFPNESVAAGHPASQAAEEGVATGRDRLAATTIVRFAALTVPVAALVLYFGVVGRQSDPAIPSGSSALVAAAMEGGAVAGGPTALTADEGVAPTVGTDGSGPAGAQAVEALAVPAGDGPADRISVVLTVATACWASLTVDGEQLLARVLQPGERYDLEIRRELVVTTRDAGAIAMTVNGVAAGPLGEAGQAVTRRVNLANYLELLKAR
jgi:cytoskeletal protein RodZ